MIWPFGNPNYHYAQYIDSMVDEYQGIYPEDDDSSCYGPGHEHKFNRNNETVRLKCEIIHFTKKAYLINWKNSEIWIPRSQIKKQKLSKDENSVILTIPRWLFNKIKDK